MISIFDHFNNDLENKQINTLKRCGFDHLNDKMAKIMLMILYGEEKFEEKNIIEFKNLVDLLKETTDPIKVLEYVDKITKGEIDENNITDENVWRRKILTEFVCEFYGNKGCTQYGAKISQSLIRVAATRIFADPEQSIMELPVNSVDSYNLLAGNKAIGRFGMGFFSIFYWLSEPIEGDFKRKMSIETRYKVSTDEDKMDGYKVSLKWTNEGLLVEKFDLNNEEFTPNGIKNTTGTIIKLDFSEHRISNRIVEKMEDYMKRLFLVEGAQIILDGEKINEDNSDKKVNVEINASYIKIEDNAAGIPFEVLENSLLVPSSSTKKRDFIPDIYLSPIIRPKNKNEDAFFAILVNNVAVVKFEILGNKSFIIKLPYNSKLPVSRDDIIFTEYEIEYFKRACIEIISNGIKNNDVLEFFITLEKYTIKNKSSLLISLVKMLRQEIENSPYILIPKTKFWIDFMKKISPSALNYFVMYDQPNMFNTERKLAPLLNVNALNNIFKLRKVVVINIDSISESGGLSEYLFVSDKFKDDISKIALKENRTLLIPYDDEYVIDVFTNEYSEIMRKAVVHKSNIFGDIIQSIGNWRYGKFFEEEVKTIGILKQSYPQIIKTLSITKMSMIRKFENYEHIYGGGTEYYLEKYTSLICTSFRLLGIDMNEVIPYLIDLNTKLMSYPISKKISYGSSPVIKITGKCRQNFNKVNSLNGFIHISTETIKMVKDSIIYCNDLLDKTKTMNTLVLPPLNLMLVSNINKNLFELHENLFGELCIGVMNCNYPVETITLIQIFLSIYEKITSEIAKKGGSVKYNGIGNYLLEQIRSKTTPNALMELHREFFAGTSMKLISYIFNPLIEIGFSYIKYMTIKEIDRKLNFQSKYTFTAKQLIEYIFNNNVEIKENNILLYEELSSQYSSYQRSEKKLQILEIAVNEGTTKGFIQSVLTELIQNSTDAIRSSEGIPNVEIFIGGDSISIKDYVGFDNLINIMVPFLSSKNPNDPNVTGEMGSGFFNVYRQPFIKEVIVSTVFNKKTRILKSIPLVENNNVYDIIYNINEYDSKEPNSSEVTLVFNNNLGMIAELVAEATIFTNCYLSFIPSIVLSCNGNKVQKNFNEVYTTEGLKFYTVDDIITSSYVMTNGIPLMSLSDFISSFDKTETKIGIYDLKNIFEKFCQNSIIIDISKNFYTPTQARNKIQFKHHVVVKSLVDEMLNGFYHSIMDLYLKPSYKSMRDTFFPNSSSLFSPDQLIISTNSPQENFLTLYHHSFIINDEGEEEEYSSIKELMDELIGSKEKPEQKYNYIPQNKVLYSWFSNKEYPKPYDEITLGFVTDGNVEKEKDEPPVPFTLLQPFINIYWEKIKILQKNRIIESKKFDKNKNAPLIYLDKMQPGLLGFYNPNKHSIYMNKFENDPKLLRTELLKFKGKDLSKITTSWIMNPVIKKYFSTCIPTATLIHEIGHAIDNDSHKNSGHGITAIKIRGSQNLDFEDMAATVFQEAVAIGLISEFLQTVN